MSLSGIRGEPEWMAGERIAAASACDARPGPGYGFQAGIRDARLTAHTSCVLSLIQALQCSFDLDNGLQIALELTHSDFAIGASRRYAGIVVRVGVHRQFVARPVYALLVNLQLCEQAFAKHFEVLAFALMGMRFGFHGSRFPSVGDGYTVRWPVMK
jgi:hypothetical protein